MICPKRSSGCVRNGQLYELSIEQERIGSLWIQREETQAGRTQGSYVTRPGPEESGSGQRLLFGANPTSTLPATIAVWIILDVDLVARNLLERVREGIAATGCDGCFDPSDPWLGPLEEQCRIGKFGGEFDMLSESRRDIRLDICEHDQDIRPDVRRYYFLSRSRGARSIVISARTSCAVG